MAQAPEQKIGPVTTSRIAASLVAEVESNLPLLVNCNKTVQKPFETAGDGTVMDVLVPECPTVGEGAWINEGDPTADHNGVVGNKGHELDYSNKAVPVVLKQKHVAFGLPSAMEFSSIDDMENMVVKPYGSTLASAVQTSVADTVLNGSAFTDVLSGADKFPEVAEAVAQLRKARTYGKLVGCVGSTLNGKLSGEGIKYFNPQNNISDIWKSARLGEYQSAEWFTTPDVEDLIVPGNSAAAGSATIASTSIQSIVRGKKLFAANDGAEVWIKSGATVDSTLAVTDGWVKGEIFTISGVDVADMFGSDLGEAYSFKVLDTEIRNESGTNYLYIKVRNPGYGEAYYSGGDDTISSVTKVTEKGSTYYRGAIYAANTLCVAFGRFAKPVNANVGAYTGQTGISIRTTEAYQVIPDRNVHRWDTLVGSALARPNHACELLILKA